VKKFLIYVLLVFVCGISAFFIYKHRQSGAYEETAVPYLNQVLPQISTWNPELLNDYMAPEVVERIPQQRLVALMDGLSRLGTLEQVERIKFKNKASGKLVTADESPVITYEIEAQYSSGPAEITISVLDQGTSFAVYHFKFYSQALADTE